MGSKKHIIVSVSNDLSFDQRVHKVCTSLHNAGYNILEKNEDIIKKMESILVGILQGDSFQHSQSDEEFEEEKANVIESELKRLGYIN